MAEAEVIIDRAKISKEIIMEKVYSKVESKFCKLNT
jgi:hypothetical protein